MNSVKNIAFTLLGYLLLIIGASYLLDIFGIGFRSWALLAVGLAVFTVYINSKNKAILYTSFVLIMSGLSILLTSMNIIPFEYSSFSLILSIAIAVILIYVVNKQTLLLYSSVAVIFFDSYILLTSLSFSGNSLTGYLFLIIGVLLVMLFAFENKKLGYSPLVLALISYFTGFANLAYYYNYINSISYKAITASIFMITGAIIVIYFYLNTRNNKKEN